MLALKTLQEEKGYEGNRCVCIDSCFFVADLSLSVFNVKVYDLLLSFILGCDLLVLNILNLL